MAPQKQNQQKNWIYRIYKNDFLQNDIFGDLKITLFEKQAETPENEKKSTRARGVEEANIHKHNARTIYIYIIHIPHTQHSPLLSFVKSVKHPKFKRDVYASMNFRLKRSKKQIFFNRIVFFLRFQFICGFSIFWRFSKMALTPSTVC